MNDIDKERFGGFLVQLRREKDLTQKELAERLFVSDKAVSKWELDDAVPDTDKLVPLARALGLSVDALLGNLPEEAGEEDSTPPAGALPEKQEKRPGWFALHWYWLGLIPVAWGCYMLVQLLLLMVSLGMILR